MDAIFKEFIWKVQDGIVLRDVLQDSCQKN